MEFKNEEEKRQEEFKKLYETADEQFEQNKAVREKGMDLFQEDWQLSQFWYSESTSRLLADEILSGADPDTVICILSAPSVYAEIKKRDPSSLPTQEIYLFEFDKRFKLLAGDKFVFYDYNDPLNYPQHLKGNVDRLLIDPPFLQRDCQTLFSQTVHSLLKADKSAKTSDGHLKYKFIEATGERMSEIVQELYPGVHPTTWLPEHGNGLSNEFLCYASYEGASWQFQK